MGANFCGCNFKDNNFVYLKGRNQIKIETNLSKIEKYSYLKETQNISISSDDLRTKSGTEWNNLSGLEKIVVLYKVNFIIKKYREHLKNKNFQYNQYNNDNTFENLNYKKFILFLFIQINNFSFLNIF